jgi:hypothetical protein
MEALASGRATRPGTAARLARLARRRAGEVMRKVPLDDDGIVGRERLLARLASAAHRAAVDGGT